MQRRGQLRNNKVRGFYYDTSGNTVYTVERSSDSATATFTPSQVSDGSYATWLNGATGYLRGWREENSTTVATNQGDVILMTDGMVKCTGTKMITPIAKDWDDFIATYVIRNYSSSLNQSLHFAVSGINSGVGMRMRTDSLIYMAYQTQGMANPERIYAQPNNYNNTEKNVLTLSRINGVDKFICNGVEFSITYNAASSNDAWINIGDQKMGMGNRIGTNTLNGEYAHFSFYPDPEGETPEGIHSNIRNSQNLTPNTFIGGVASTIPDSATLATKLTSNDYPITENDIGYFEISGSAIIAAINKNYKLPPAFEKDNITHYEDLGGKCIRSGEYYTTAPNLIYLNFPNATSIGSYYARLSSGNVFKVLKLKSIKSLSLHNLYWNQYVELNVFYIPECTNFGGSAGKDSFYDYYDVKRFYVHPSLETINNGEPDGNLVYFRDSRGSEIHYVQNYTKPSEITDLSYTTNGTDVTLTFTPPSSTNTLDFYEVYVNGFYKQEISGSGAVISGLSNGDKVTVYACDEYYNRSVSNEVTISGI